MTPEPTTKVHMLRLKEIRSPEDLKKLQEGQHVVLYCPYPITGILVKKESASGKYGIIRKCKKDNSISEHIIGADLSGLSERIVRQDEPDFETYNKIFEKSIELRQETGGAI